MQTQFDLDEISRQKIMADVSNYYASVIADIYAEHHANPFTDIKKHNEGIIRAMVEFAIFYKEHSTISKETCAD